MSSALRLEDLPGIKPHLITRLKQGGVETVFDLAASSPLELIEYGGGVLTREEEMTALELVTIAKKALVASGSLFQDFSTADQILERRRNLLRCSTGSLRLDSFLKGGVETQAITEFAGEFGSGKSQICYTLCMTANLPKVKGGFGGNVIFIDTENTFRPERVRQIAEIRGISNPDDILKKIYVCKIYNSGNLEIIFHELGKSIQEYHAKLVLIDSLISLHRAEFVGRETLATRQQRLSIMLHKLTTLAEIHNVAVVVTNQVQSTPDNFFSGNDSIRVTGGNVVAHATTYRILLRKAGRDRIAIMLDSPCHAYDQTKFTIDERGVTLKKRTPRAQNGDQEMSVKTIQEKEYPDPRTLPAQPSWQQTLPQLTLSDLIPGKYVTATARVVFLRTSQRQDALGSKTIFSGVLEDSSFKVPFVSHRITYPLLRNSIYKFYSAYVHEFEDKSLLLIITEKTKIETKSIEDYREFVWAPKIESIKRPVHYINLQGVITTVHSNSGLVKRCNNCKSILYDSCPNNCKEERGWNWDLRISSRLYDGSGSIKMILTKDLASKVVQRNLSELILLANGSSYSGAKNQFQTSICKIPDTIEIMEAVCENASPSSFRKSGKLIITNGINLVYFPAKEKHIFNFKDYNRRELHTSDPEDKKIIKRLIEKALEISVKKVTGNRMMHGIFLLEDPVPLYRCERAKLFLGFSARANLMENELQIEFTPQAYIRESVLDYVNLRRERGASSSAISKNLITYRNRVVVAPSGNYGSINEIIMRKAGNQKVSETDTRNLVEFWKQIYDIDIAPDEVPLLKIKMVNSEITFTYPPSMCFFAGGDSLVIPAGVQKFIEYKKSNLKTRMDEIANKSIHDLKIGDLSLGSESIVTDQNPGIQTQLLQDIREKLFSRNISARGSILSVHDELWFFPGQIQLS